MNDQTDLDDNSMETTVSVTESTKTNVLQLNSSLNIISRKPSGNAVFIVPQQNTSTDDNESINQLANNFSPPSSVLVDDKKIASNKLTLIPLNLNSQTSHSPIKLPGSTTPVKSLNESSMKAIISPVIGSKKVIISTPSSGLSQTAIKTTSVNLSASNSGSGDKPIVTPFNNRLSVANNTKIFTISTPNNLKTLSQQPTVSNSGSSSSSSGNSLTQQNISTINATSITNNPNKIQYVKIVNTANNTQHIQVHQQTIPTTVTPTKPTSLTANNKAIKITTITANTNNNSIITTTTNKNNNNDNINNDIINLNNNSMLISSVKRFFFFYYY